MKKYVMALDAGTTSNRAILFTADGRIAAVAQKEFRQIYPKPGWVEHDAEEILSTQLEVARDVLKTAGVAAADVAAIKRGCFCTAPSIPNAPRNFLSEFIGTFLLVFTIKGIAQVTGCAGGLSYVFVFGIIVSIGMSLGGLTGYAINPARDLGPRIAHALLPVPGKGPSNGGYAWIPVVAPIAGALAAVALYAAIPWPTAF